MLSGRTAELAYLKSALSHTEQRKVKTNVRGSLHGLSFPYTIHWLFTLFASQPLLESPKEDRRRQAPIEDLHGVDSKFYMA